MKSIFPFVFFLSMALICQGQEVKTASEHQIPGKGKISELQWLVGYWTGTGLGGECEEVWMPAVDGQMIGTFRFWKEGKLIFSEFMHLIQEEESITLKLKHFNPDLSGWEEKEEWTTFSLIELGEEKAWFEGLTMERKGEKLLISVELGEKGVSRIEKFSYSKKAL
ncbi:MAG: DUF6265 family protein [Bacteroidota bacterium]